MIVVLVQLDAGEQAVVFLQRLLGDQGLQGDGGEERRAADAGQQAHGGGAVVHGVEHADVHFLRLVDLVGEHHVGDGVIGLHLAGEQVLAAIRVGEGRHAQIQRDLNGVPVGGAGEPQQGAHHLAHTAVVVVHIRQGLVEVVVLGQCRILVEHRRLVVDEALQVDVQGPGHIVQSLHVDGDGAVFILGHRGLAFVDHGGELLNGIAAAFPIFFDTLANKIRKRAQKRHLLIME